MSNLSSLLLFAQYSISIFFCKLCKVWWMMMIIMREFFTWKESLAYCVAYHNSPGWLHQWGFKNHISSMHTVFLAKPIAKSRTNYDSILSGVLEACLMAKQKPFLRSIIEVWMAFASKAQPSNVTIMCCNDDLSSTMSWVELVVY